MAKQRSFRPLVVISDGSEDDKPLSDEENVHEDTEAAAAADSDRVTPSPVPASKEEVAAKEISPPLPAVWSSSVYSPPSAVAVILNGNNDFAEFDSSLQRQQSNATVPAGATLTLPSSARSAFDNRALAFSQARNALSLVQAAEGTLRLPRAIADFDDRAQAFAEVEDALSQVQATAAAAAFGPKEIIDAEGKAILDAEEKHDWKKAQKELDDLFEQQSKEKFEGIPHFEMPSGFQDHLTFFDYQKDGIRWLVHQETCENRLGPFWKERFFGANARRWWCSVTGATRINKPKQTIRASILADDMGLGKTLQTIGLILANPPEKGAASCTLIVAPVTVMTNWKIQIEKFVKPGRLKVALYHGSKREQELKKVKRNELDVLIAPYNTLVSDHNLHKEMMDELAEVKEEKKRNPKKAKRDEVRAAWDNANEDEWKPDSGEDDDDDHYLPPSMLKKRKRKTAPKTSWIFDLEFHRIVLDEAHIIRNSKTGFFQSVMKVPSERKLCLTGTPFVNKPADIHSLLAFLGAEPLNDKNTFALKVVQPILECKEIGLSRIRSMMGHVALRRTKALVESTIQLVPKEVLVRTVHWPEGFHKDVHDVFYETARAAFIGLLRGGSKKVFQNFYAFLALVMRVRQSCCHGGLVPIDSLKVAEEVHREFKARGDIELSAEEGEALLKKLLNVFKREDAIDTECAVCCEELEEGNAVVLRSCKHVFCEECLDQISNQLCPFCRAPYGASDMIKKSVAQEATKKERGQPKKKKEVAGRHGSEIAPKVQALLDAMDEMMPDDKGVIFSQWTSYLDIVQDALEESGHTYTRIDGSMSAMERITAMEEFSSDSEDTPRFILCSLHACGTGINLTRGSWVFMLDCWWNYAAENQAMDRVHRIGQTRPVHVVRFIMQDSIEERMINLQEAKSALGKGSLQKLSSEERKKARITALKDLFQVGETEQKWDGYYEDEENDDLGDFIVHDDHVE